MRLIDRFEGFVLDLDGTVYLGDALLPGAAETIAEIRSRGKRLAYLTNKPLEEPAAYAHKLSSLGVDTEPEDVISSLDSLVTYLHERHPGGPVLPVTERLVADILAAQGFPIVELDDAIDAEVVVVSFDRTFDYRKLHAAYRAVRSGAVVVATNPDAYCPTPDGGLPDCAAMLAAIEACTGATAEAVLGKPSSYMAAAVLQRLDLPAGRVLLVGDRHETDVVMAANAGMKSALVMTGATTREEARRADPYPDLILERLSGLLEVEIETQPI